MLGNCVADPMMTATAISLVSKWSVTLLLLAMEDAMSIVFAVCPEIRMCTNVYVDDETIHMEVNTNEEEKVWPFWALFLFVQL